MSPTQRTLKALREDGWHPVIVETFNHWSKRRHDMFGFADILAMRAGDVPVLIQTTTGGNLAARRTKIMENELAPLALRSGFRIILHGWAKYKVKRGGKAMVWRCREEEMTLESWDCPTGSSVRGMPA